MSKADANQSSVINTNVDRSKLIREIFNDLRKDNLQILDRFYDPNVKFQDPLGNINSLASIKKYYEGMYQNVETIRFDFNKEIVSGSEHVMFWDLVMKAKGLNGGKEFVVQGNSLIRFNSRNLVEFHRDYFDMGDLVYRRIPILKSLISIIDGRLQHKE